MSQTETSSEATKAPWSVRRAMGGGQYHHITSPTRDNIAVFTSAVDADLVVRLFNGHSGSKPDQETSETTQALLALLREICDRSDARVPRAGIREPEAEALYLRARAAIALATRA